MRDITSCFLQVMLTGVEICSTNEKEKYIFLTFGKGNTTQNSLPTEINLSNFFGKTAVD